MQIIAFVLHLYYLRKWRELGAVGGFIREGRRVWHYGLGGGGLIGEERLLERVRLFEEMWYVLFEKKGWRAFLSDLINDSLL